MSSSFLDINKYLGVGEKEHPINKKQRDNAVDLLIRVNKLLEKLKIETSITSGYRTPAHNVAIGGSKKSAHVECMAVDLFDKDGSLGKLIEANQKLLIEYGLFLESPAHTQKKNAKGEMVYWVHLQTRPTKNRVFIP